MKNIIIVTAHPSSKWFTHDIAKKYQESAELEGNSVTIIDLYSDEYKQDYLAFENIKDDWPKDDTIKKIQKLMSEANEFVFVAPIWWGQVPAVMKNFIDVNFSAGFAFKYEKWWKIVWLFKWKTARVFLTCDAPGFIYKMIPFAMRFKWYFWMYVFGFCGMKLKSCNIFDHMHKNKSSESRKKMLSTVEKIAKKS